MSNTKQYMTIEKQRHRAVAILQKIQKQFPKEDKLFFRIFERTVLDLFENAWRSSAVSYLNSSRFCFDVCGVDRDWVLHQLKQSGVCFDMRCRDSGWKHDRDGCDYAWCSRPLVLTKPTNQSTAKPETVKKAIRSTENATYEQLRDARPRDMRGTGYNKQKVAVLDQLRAMV